MTTPAPSRPNGDGYGDTHPRRRPLLLIAFALISTHCHAGCAYTGNPDIAFGSVPLPLPGATPGTVLATRQVTMTIACQSDSDETPQRFYLWLHPALSGAAGDAWTTATPALAIRITDMRTGRVVSAHPPGADVKMIGLQAGASREVWHFDWRYDLVWNGEPLRAGPYPGDPLLAFGWQAEEDAAPVDFDFAVQVLPFQLTYRSVTLPHGESLHGT